MWQALGRAHEREALGRAFYAFRRTSNQLRVQALLRTIHHPSISEIELPEVLHALSDPVRLEIVRDLAENPNRACGELDARVAKSTLSHHLKVLREAGLIRTEPEGTARLLSLRDSDLERRFPGLLESILDATG